MKVKNNYTYEGTHLSEAFAKELVQNMVEKSPEYKEQLMSEGHVFKEDNTMDNSGSFYTTALAKAIYAKSYDMFKQYYDMTWVLTPADIGQIAGTGAYKVPKVLPGTAMKLGEGEQISYLNDQKGDVVISTEDYAVGTKITRRGKKRFGAGIISKLLTEGSKAVQRLVVTDMVNFWITSADHVLSAGVSYEQVRTAIAEIKKSEYNGQKLGLNPDFVGFTADGWLHFGNDEDVKTAVAMGQRNVPGSKLDDSYQVILGLKVADISLATADKAGQNVECIVVDSQNFSMFLQDEHDTFDGRLPGTAGDTEIIEVVSAGIAVLNTKGACVITES